MTAGQPVPLETFHTLFPTAQTAESPSHEMNTYELHTIFTTQTPQMQYHGMHKCELQAPFPTTQPSEPLNNGMNKYELRAPVPTTQLSEQPNDGINK